MVADASPICYLVLIGEIDLLPRLFARVLLPRQVHAELMADGAPAAVRAWAATLPQWVSVHDVPSESASGVPLQAGEWAAILLAESKSAHLVLLDEKSARRVAIERGLRVTGVLGILAEARNLGLLDFVSAFERLTKTNFRYSPALLRTILERFSKK